LKQLETKINIVNIENIKIRRISTDDVLALQKISIQTFTETFTLGNTEENLKTYLDNSFTFSKLMDEVNNSYSEFYFAESECDVIGYLKLNFGNSQTELKDNKAIEIERIYVLQEFHGKKVGQILYEKAIEIAKLNDAEYVWLGVWEENPRAISFYKKNGFVEFDKHIFKMGNEEQTDIMMKLQLEYQ
jgi:ribosomal protein S18 acetylase RimI-like enzyme